MGKSDNKKAVTSWLKPATLEWVHTEAKRRGAPVSQVVEDLLEETLKYREARGQEKIHQQLKVHEQLLWTLALESGINSRLTHQLLVSQLGPENARVLAEIARRSSEDSAHCRMNGEQKA